MTKDAVQTRPDEGAEKNFFMIAVLMLCALLLPWAAVQLQMRVADDGVWLTEAAQRFLDGQKMAEAYFDTNPPLSFLIYIPAVLLGKLGVPLWYAITVYGMVLSALAVFLSAHLVARWEGIGMIPRFAVITAYVMNITLLSQYAFAQKDHLIAVGIFPFILAQYAITYHYDRCKIVLWGALLFGLPFVLMKPHFLLLPAAMIAHRLYTQRDIKALIKPDVVCLLVGGLAYTIVSFALFPDFFSVILPAVTALYAGDIHPEVYKAAGSLAVFTGCVFAGTNFIDKDKPEARRAGLFLSLMAVLAVVPFFLQLKGYSMHMMPVMTFVWAALAFSLSWMCEKVMHKEKYLLFYTVAVICGIAYFLSFPNTRYPTHDSMEHMGFVRFLEQRNIKNGFMMQADSTNGFASASMYSGTPYASRFPCEWFLPLSGDPQIAAAQKQQFGTYLAEDIERFQPEVIGLYSEPFPEADILAIFGDVPAFAKAWESYELVDTHPVNFGEFFRGTPHIGRNRPSVMYDIYKRKGVKL